MSEHRVRLAAHQVKAAVDGFRYREIGILAAVEADDLGAIVKALGLSQTEAAMITGYHRATMSKWCRKGGAPVIVHRLLHIWAMLDRKQRRTLSTRSDSPVLPHR